MSFEIPADIAAPLDAITPAPPAAPATPEPKPAAPQKTGKAFDKFFDEGKLETKPAEPSGDPEFDKEIAAIGTSDKKIRDAFKEAKTAQREAKRQAAELEARYKELEAKHAGAKPSEGSTASDAKLAELQKALEERETRLAAYDIESTAQFQDAVGKPAGKIAEDARALAAKYKISETAIVAAIRTGDSDALDKLVEGMNRFDTSRIVAAFDKMAEINEKAAALKAGAREALARIQAEQKAAYDARATGEAKLTEAQKAARASEIAKHQAESWESLSKSVPILRKHDGTDEAVLKWNAAVDNATALAKTDVSSLDAATQVRVVQQAAILPLVLGARQAAVAEAAALRTQLATAQAEIAKLTSAHPAAGGGGKAAAATGAARAKVPFAGFLS